MDWSIPGTFYPTGLPTTLVWALFVLACVATIIGTAIAINRRGVRAGLLLAIPIAAAMLVASMMISMVVMFFVHDQ